MTTADLAAACACHGWTLERDGDGWTLRGNGSDAAFGSTESLALWLAKQKDAPEKRPRDVRQLEMQLEAA